MTEDIKDSILETIGGTPIVRLNKLPDPDGADVLVKVEFFNPGGSVKDRIAVTMIEEAERTGKLKPGGTVIEATSGNTGIGLAVAAAVKGYKTIIVMTDKQVREKVEILKALGAEVVIVPASAEPDSPDYNITTAHRIHKETPNSFMTDQDYNQVNPDTHYKYTGAEIWEQTGGKIDVFVAGIGTGGTVSGIGRYLKEQSPNIKVIGVEPQGSILKEYKETGKMSSYKPFLVEGIGADMVPETLHMKYIDEIAIVSDKDSFETARRLTREEGIFCGMTAGTNVYTALRIARSLPEDKVVLTIIPDTGERYMSKLYSDKWLKKYGFTDY